MAVDPKHVLVQPRDDINDVVIAQYSLGYFPETQEESTKMGQEIVAKQTIAINRLIGVAFEQVFGRMFDDSLLPECTRVQMGNIPDGKQLLMWNNNPFLELGEIEEEFKDVDGVPHIVFSQQYRVLT